MVFFNVLGLYLCFDSVLMFKFGYVCCLSFRLFGLVDFCSCFVWYGLVVRFVLSTSCIGFGVGCRWLLCA